MRAERDYLVGGTLPSGIAGRPLKRSFYPSDLILGGKKNEEESHHEYWRGRRKNGQGKVKESFPKGESTNWGRSTKERAARGGDQGASPSRIRKAS